MKRLGELESQVQLRSQKKMGTQDFHYEAKELFQQITKTVADTSRELIQDTKSTTVANEALNQPHISSSYPSLQLALDQKSISSYIIDELVNYEKNLKTQVDLDLLLIKSQELIILKPLLELLLKLNLKL